MTKHLGGICVFAPRRAYQDFRFDETDTLHGTQDSDFSRHALRHGYRLAYVEDLEVEHMDGTRGQVVKYPDYFREYYETWKWRPYGRRVGPRELALMTFKRWRDRRRLLKRFPAYMTTLTHPKRVVFLPGVTENPYLSLPARELARNEFGAGSRGGCRRAGCCLIGGYTASYTCTGLNSFTTGTTASEASGITPTLSPSCVWRASLDISWFGRPTT